MIGIGGAGMSGIAEILLANGFYVSGSDLSESDVIARLRMLGATIYLGHRPEQIGEASCVVYSSAIRPDNEELEAARQRKIPTIPRAEMLAEIMRMKTSIAVAGTHGKTTTTSLIATIFNDDPRLQPTAIIGGRLLRPAEQQGKAPEQAQLTANQLNEEMGTSGVILGEGDILIAEADEFDRSFLKLHPTCVVITNIDADHLECYGSFEELKKAFFEFANRVPFWGKVVLCLEDSALQEGLAFINRPLITYGLTPQADLQATDIIFEQRGSQYKLHINSPHLFPENSYSDTYSVHLNLPGLHNVLNSLAAIGISLEFGIPIERILKTLNHFGGVSRRFEILGEKRGVMVVDDYAHHPTEVSHTILAAKEGYHRRIIAVFQPHLFSRTLALHQEFGRALLNAEVAVVLPIYPSREQPIPGVSSEKIVEDARNFGHKMTVFAPDFEEGVNFVLKIAQENDLVLVMGAGNVRTVAEKILKAL